MVGELTFLSDADASLRSGRTRPGLARALQALAWLALALMLARAVALWAADPLLGYANNWDQYRTTEVFGLKPRDSGKEMHAATPDQPWRFYVKAAPWQKPQYPSSDVLVKALQVAVMTALEGPDGVIDIKVAGATLLLVWLAGMLWIFARLLARPAAALGFALWCCVLADPINLLFLNTLYAEFSAFMAVTFLVGVLWLWLEKRLSSRRTLQMGAILALFLVFHRNQWAFLGVALLPLAFGLAFLDRQRLRFSPPRLAAVAVWTVAAAVICLSPPAVYGKLRSAKSANRIDTVMGTLLPASKNPQAMLRAMKLPASCLAMSGKNWYTASTAEFQTQCPPIMNLSLTRIGRALAVEPRVMAPIIRNISINQRGFLQHHLGQVEGSPWATVAGADGWASASIDGMLTQLAPAWAEALIWLLMACPFALAVIFWAAGGRRWAIMFAAQGVLFNYALFSSILGDGYVELERHAMLCFSFGALLPVLLLTAVCSRLLEGRRRAE